MTTTQADSGADRPVDRVDRHFVATRPNQLWVSDFTYVATWRGFVYVAFVIDMFAPRIVGWRVANSLRTDFVLDALESAIYDRRGDGAGDLVQHSDRGTQYVSMRYTARLADAGSALSVGRRGAAYDNALAETIIGLFKTEAIRRRGPWRHIAAVEFATRAWVDQPSSNQEDVDEGDRAEEGVPEPQPELVVRKETEPYRQGDDPEFQWRFSEERAGVGLRIHGKHGLRAGAGRQPASTFEHAVDGI